VNTHLNTCGCFPALPVPPRIFNRAGLDTLEYRIAKHPDVLARLLALLDSAGRAPAVTDDVGPVPMWMLVSDAHAEPLVTGTADAALDTGTSIARLARLTTRELDDPAIALLDAYAVVADVLAFYQERIANEGFLRTATERASVLELARLIGYELAPGVAARTWLTFEVEERGDAGPISAEPPSALVPRHTRVQSLPAGGGLPQTFETSDDLAAHAERNALRPQLTGPQPLTTDSQTIYLRGTSTGTRVGDWMVIAAGSPGGSIVGAPTACRVRRVIVEADRDRTRVDFLEDPPEVPAGSLSTGPPGTVQLGPVGFDKSQVDLALRSSWSNSNITTFLAMQGWPVGALYGYASTPAPPPKVLPAATAGVYRLRRRAGIFGHNAPRLGKALEADGWSRDWDDTKNSIHAATKNSQSTGTAGSYQHGVDLEAVFPEIVPGTWAVLVDNAKTKVVRVADASESSRVDYAISGKVTHLELQNSNGTAASGLTGFGLRSTSVHCDSERLELADLPLPEVLPAGTVELTLDRLVLGLEASQPVAVLGEDGQLDGVRWAEVTRLTGITHGGGRTTIALDALSKAYKRATVTVNANVVEATHGETVDEVLGDGSGKADQRFMLRKPPLTYVQAPTVTGAASTLELRVDGVRWYEAPTLHELGPTDERFVVRHDDDDGTSILFGDGRRGARPPAGQENVRARYRSGIGSPGLIEAGGLSLLQTRPPGIREVLNPVPALGAEDPESLDDARVHAPLDVMTLERVVALGDYEEFALGFAGVGKARATRLWRAERSIVHVTVAGLHGSEIGEDMRTNLRQALRAAGDPGVEVLVGSFVKLPFDLHVSLLLESRAPENTAESARRQLADELSFTRRAFGQPLTAAEIIAFVHRTPHVVDVQVDVLRPVPPPAGVQRQGPLVAQLARWTDSTSGQIAPAELLMLIPTGPEVETRWEVDA
jgi:hypothetical protein